MYDGQKLIKAWYEVIDTEKFLELYPVNERVSGSAAEEYLQVHYRWIKQADIAKTPTTFVNGYELPSAYRMKDLSVLIPGLLDVFGNQNGMNTMNVNSGSAKISERHTVV